MSKYHNVRTRGYASKAEAGRAAELELLSKAGKVRNLRAQVRYILVPDFPDERGVSYVADFVYEELLDRPQLCIRPGIGLTPWQEVVEDCKGFRTREYILKRKLMRHIHGIKILETGQQKAARRRPKRRELQTQSKSGRTSSQ